jgi:hypothetical protein
MLIIYRKRPLLLYLKHLEQPMVVGCYNSQPACCVLRNKLAECKEFAVVADESTDINSVAGHYIQQKLLILQKLLCHVYHHLDLILQMLWQRLLTERQ